jgi:hypothetical protein
MASLDFDSIESLIEYMKIEYKLLDEEIINELEKKQFSEYETIEFEIL